MEVYKDKDWLRKKHWDENLSLADMAKEGKCCTQTILNWMIKLGVQHRTIKKNQPYHNKDWIINEYYGKYKSVPIIANEQGIATSTLYLIMNKFDITRRKKHTAEELKRMSKSQKGRIFSKESRMKMSIAKKGKMPKYIPTYKGMKHNAEELKKMSEAQKGEKSRMYGVIGELHPNWKGIHIMGIIGKLSVRKH